MDPQMLIAMAEQALAKLDAVLTENERVMGALETDESEELAA